MELSEEKKAQAIADAAASSVLPNTNTTTIERWSCAKCMDRTCEETPQNITDIEQHLLEQCAVLYIHPHDANGFCYTDTR